MSSRRTSHELYHISRLPMRNSSSFEGETIGSALKLLLSTLWEEQEGFSGKRPFGNSDWDTDFMEALVFGNVIWGVFDEEGVCLETYERDDGHKVIAALIKSMTFG